MQLTLTPEIEHALKDQARRQGTTPEHLALETLKKRFLITTPEKEETSEKSLADLLDGFIGSLHSAEHDSDGGHLSEGSGRKFAQGMIEKREKGHL